jgi:hypothetical protein
MILQLTNKMETSLCDKANHSIRRITQQGIFHYFCCLLLKQIKEKFQHFLVHNKDFLMGMENLQSLIHQVGFSLTKIVNHYLFVIVIITNYERFSSMVIPKPPISLFFHHFYLFFLLKVCCLTINKGEVETMCVVVTENNTILVSSKNNKVYKIIPQGIIACSGSNL